MITIWKQRLKPAVSSGILLFALSLCIWTFNDAAAGQSALLFDAMSPPEHVVLPGHAKGGDTIRVNRRALRHGIVRIPLSDDLEIIAVRDRIDMSKDGTTVWIGHVQGDGGTVTITLHGNAVAAIINYDGTIFEITANRHGQTILIEVDETLLPPLEPDVLPQGQGAPGGGEAPAAEPALVIQDLMTVYTQASCNAVGGCTQMQANIITAVNDTNQAYLSSAVDIQLNLVMNQLVDYAENGDMRRSLDHLTYQGGSNDPQGEMDVVHQWRDQVGADLVALITNDTNYCGIAWVSSYQGSAFSVTAWDCLSNRTLAHEIGHNQGNAHNRENASVSGTYAYSYGYRRCVTNPRFRTIMSYSAGCVGTRINNFSNPQVYSGGVPTGIDHAVDPDNSADNARSMNNTASYVAGFKTGPTAPPATPSALSASAVSYSQIDLSWTDNADNETGFQVERSPDGTAGSWSLTATLGSNAASFSDTGLEAATNYHYRVFAYNSTGPSGYTTIAQATTLALPDTIEDVALADIFGNGSVTGTYADTNVANGSSTQTITETGTGPKKRRKYSLNHSWEFDVFDGGGTVTFTAEASPSVDSSEGFLFTYSSDGGVTYNDMFTVDPNSVPAPGGYTFHMPGGTSGQVLVRVTDATQQPGEAIDSINVHHMVFTSYTQTGNPPGEPVNLSVVSNTASSVTLEFQDGSMDEWGFEIWRADGTIASGCGEGSRVGEAPPIETFPGLVTYVDNTVSGGSSYCYWVVSYNGAGDNGLSSNIVDVITPAAPVITLSATGYKVKGTKNVDLTWDGATTAEVVVWRDGVAIALVANPGAWTDTTLGKGGGSYSYEVCEMGQNPACSAPVLVTF